MHLYAGAYHIFRRAAPQAGLYCFYLSMTMPPRVRGPTFGSRRGPILLVLLAALVSVSAWTFSRAAYQVKPLPAPIERGMSFVHSVGQGGGTGYGSVTSKASLRELHDLGVRWVSLMPFGFMNSPRETSVHWVGGTQAGESDERLRRETAAAHGLGIKVMLKPHLWIRGGQWCGVIDPSSGPGPRPGWAEWFASYQDFLLRYARLAAEIGADSLVVGVELCKSTATPEGEQRWRGLIAEVRKVFHGPLVYAANWDEVERVPFWDAVDFIGTQFYPPLADAANASPAAMAGRLRIELDRLATVSHRVQRPVIFTEVGYKSIRDTILSPHLWPEHLKGEEQVSEPAQAQAYQVFFDGIRDRDFVRGVYPWKWFSDPDSTEEGPAGFGIRGKLAERVIRSAYRL